MLQISLLQVVALSAGTGTVGATPRIDGGNGLAGHKTLVPLFRTVAKGVSRLDDDIEVMFQFVGDAEIPHGQ